MPYTLLTYGVLGSLGSRVPSRKTLGQADTRKELHMTYKTFLNTVADIADKTHGTLP